MREKEFLSLDGEQATDEVVQQFHCLDENSDNSLTKIKRINQKTIKDLWVNQINQSSDWILLTMLHLEIQEFVLAGIF